MQDFLNMFFRDIYRPIPPVYNLALAMLWRHPENIDLDSVKVVHYCAAVSGDNNLITSSPVVNYYYLSVLLT